jgi:hypothetical protein
MPRQRLFADGLIQPDVKRLGIRGQDGTFL